MKFTQTAIALAVLTGVLAQNELPNLATILGELSSLAPHLATVNPELNSWLDVYVPAIASLEGQYTTDQAALYSALDVLFSTAPNPFTDIPGFGTESPWTGPAAYSEYLESVFDMVPATVSASGSVGGSAAALATASSVASATGSGVSSAANAESSSVATITTSSSSTASVNDSGTAITFVSESVPSGPIRTDTSPSPSARTATSSTSSSSTTRSGNNVARIHPTGIAAAVGSLAGIALLFI